MVKVRPFLSLRQILARPAQRKGWSIISWSINSWSINSCRITGRSVGSRVVAEQEFSEGSNRWLALGCAQQQPAPSRPDSSRSPVVQAKSCPGRFRSSVTDLGGPVRWAVSCAEGECSAGFFWEMYDPRRGFAGKGQTA